MTSAKFARGVALAGVTAGLTARATLASVPHPVGDAEWNTIAGARAAETYTIVKGDTLSAISERFFGDPHYWPKIWALNHSTITNPHWIYPGNLVTFQPGSGSSLPGVMIAQGGPGENGATTQTDDSHLPEWKRLPPQRWEQFQVKMPPEIDPLGFDKRSKITFKSTTGIELPYIASTEEIKVLGKIKRARIEATILTLHDTVFVDAEEGAIQIGQTYAISKEPAILTSPASRGAGHAYPILGRVRIDAARDSLYVGEITGAAAPITRDSILIPLPARIPEYVPIPATVGEQGEVHGTVLLDRENRANSAAQHHIVFVDRGSEDGVQPGMIFRVYQHDDPKDDSEITDKPTLMLADLMVIQTSERFSQTRVLRSLSPVAHNMQATLLTDVSDLMHGKAGAVTPPPGEPPLPPGPSSEDDLDKLDSGGDATPEEQKTLKQLEQHPPNDAAPPPPPEGDLPPPPDAPTAPLEVPEAASDMVPPPPPATDGDVLPPPPP